MDYDVNISSKIFNRFYKGTAEIIFQLHTTLASAVFGDKKCQHACQIPALRTHASRWFSPYLAAVL